MLAKRLASCNKPVRHRRAAYGSRGSPFAPATSCKRSVKRSVAAAIRRPFETPPAVQFGVRAGTAQRLLP